jgi:hypothetical protein
MDIPLNTSLTGPPTHGAALETTEATSRAVSILVSFPRNPKTDMEREHKEGYLPQFLLVE